MKWKYIRDELRFLFCDWYISFFLLVGLWLFTEGLTDVLMLTLGDGDDTWFSASGAAALFGVALAGFLVALIQCSSNFELAVSMGRTRKAYLLSSFVANAVYTMGFALLAYPLSWASELARRVLFPAMPLSGGTVVASNSGLLVFHELFWVIPMGALTALALGAVMGAVCQRWGQYGFLAIWLGGIALGSLLGKAAELYQEGRAGILTPVMDVLAAVFRTIGSWGLGGILAVWLAAVVLVLLICYLVLRKAAVKGI